MIKPPRYLKVAFAAYAIALAAAVIFFVALLFIAGHELALRVWEPLPIFVLWVIGLPIAAKYLR